jgi:hypothetical protein
MRKRVSSTLVIAAACAALAAAIFAVGAQAATRHFDATVIAKDSGAKTFQVRTQSGAKVTFGVNSRTTFDRIGGFAGLAKGMAIEIEATNSGGSWVALKIEPRASGGGGGGGGHDDGGGHGHDDGPGHT